MDVKGINSGIIATTKKDDKHQATIQRVQAEFINQLYQGKSETEAFKNSLRAIDEKYNPKEDEFRTEKGSTVGQASALHNTEKLGGAMSMMKAIKLPSSKTVLKWLKFIAETLPILLEIINNLPKSDKKPSEELNVAA